MTSVTELNWTELNWTELNWTELNWTELNWTELNWTELNWIEPNWTVCLRMDEYFDMSKEEAPDNAPMMFITFPSAKDPTAKIRHPGEAADNTLTCHSGAVYLP